MRNTFDRLACSHIAVWSAAPDSAAGGVATLIRRATFPQVHVEHEVLLPGRILSLSVQVGVKSIRIINIHNFRSSPRPLRS